MKKKKNAFNLLATLCLALFFVNAKPAALPDLEKPATIKATTLLSADLLKGPGYTVDPDVTTDGYFGNFVLNMQAGELNVRGSELLKIRISEIPAIEKLQEVSKTEVFAKSAARAATKPIKSLQKVAEDPKETVKGIPSGVGRFFKRTAKAVEKGVDAVKDKDDKEETGETEGQGSSGEAVKEISGYNRILRELAKNLQVDPYTTNAILKKEMEGVAKAAFAGGFTTKVAIPNAPRPISTLVRISNLVWDMPPEDLEELNKKKLQAMNVPEDSIKAFLKNRNFTPTTATAFVSVLEELKTVPGIADAVKAASNADSEDEAHFFIGSASILKSFHRKSPISNIYKTGLVITGKTRERKMIVPAGLDYVSWTQEIAEFAQRKELQGWKKTLLLSGKLSPTAKKGFTTLGWQIQENYGGTDEHR